MKSLLLVDDEPLVTDSLKHIFEHKGYLVYGCYDGEEAIEIIDNGFRFGLAVIDVSLAGSAVSGSDVIKYIREKSPKTFIICNSGYAGEEYEPAGANVCLVKPTSVEEFESYFSRFYPEDF